MAEAPLILPGRPTLIVTMYVRKTTRRYKQTYTNYLLLSRSILPTTTPEVVCSLAISPLAAEECSVSLASRRALVDRSICFQSLILKWMRLFASSKEALLVRGNQHHNDPSQPSDLVTVHATGYRQYRICRTCPCRLSVSKRGILRELRGSASYQAIELTCAYVEPAIHHSEHAMPDWIRSTALETSWVSISPARP